MTHDLTDSEESKPLEGGRGKCVCVCVYTKICVQTQHKVKIVWGPLIICHFAGFLIELTSLRSDAVFSILYIQLC